MPSYPEDFFDRQYAALAHEPTKAVDHPFYLPFLAWAKTRNDIVCEMLGRQHFENVAELGCGKCDLAARIVGNLGRYTGLDISPFQLSQAPLSLRNLGKVTLQNHDLNQTLPFPDHSLDLVISASTLEYLFDPMAFVKEIHRVLIPQKTLILHTMNLAFFLRRIQLLFGKLPTFNAAPGWQGGVLHEFTYSTLRKLLQQTGFAVSETRCAGLLPRWRMLWPSLLAGDMIFRCAKEGPAAASPPPEPTP